MSAFRERSGLRPMITSIRSRSGALQADGTYRDAFLWRAGSPIELLE
jgi:hypothetical protein